MTYPTVTNTFTSGSTGYASSVNQNFTDLVNAYSDGTKELVFNKLDATSVQFSGVFYGNDLAATKIYCTQASLAKTSTPVTGVLYPNFLAFAWAHTKATAASIVAAYNLSVSTAGTGYYSYTFLTQPLNSNYTVLCAFNNTQTSGILGNVPGTISVCTMSTAGFVVHTYDMFDRSAVYNYSHNIVVFGDLA